MASLNLGAASLINESWVVLGSSLKLRIGFRSKRFRRVAERFRVQQMSVKEERTKQELARSAKRSESLRQIFKQYGISVESPEENNASRSPDDLDYEEKHDAVPSSVVDDSKMNTTEELPDSRRQEKDRETVSITEDVSGQNHHNCKEKHDAVPSSVIDDSKMNTTELPDFRRQERHSETVSITEDVSGQSHHNCEEKHDAVPSSVIDDYKMNTTEELPDLRPQEKYCETVSTTEDVSGQNHHNFPHLNTGALFTASLLPVLGFCIVCIIGTLLTIISRKRSRGHHQHASKRTRWRTALSDLKDPLASDEHDTSPEHRVSSADQEAIYEVDEACSRVELEYKRFLLECGLSES